MIMNKILNKLSLSLVIKQNLTTLQFQNKYAMSMLTDKLTQKQNKKAQQQFKRQIEYMANKPTFTYMDYKQRVTDQLNNLKSSIRKKMSQQAKDAEKSLFLEKKIMSAFFQEQLVGDTDIFEEKKKQISLVAEVPIQKVKETLKKAKSYMKMHKFLRNKILKGEPLPDSMAQLQYDFRYSRYQFSGKQRIYMRYKQERGKGYMRASRIRYMKFKK